MNTDLRLIRGLAHVLLFASGAAAATYGWWFLIILAPAIVLCFWHNAKVDRLIDKFAHSLRVVADAAVGFEAVIEAMDVENVELAHQVRSLGGVPHDSINQKDV